MPKFLRDIDLTNNNLLNAGNIYTKTQMDSSLGLKADAATTYTKTQEDTAHGLLVTKTTTVNGHALSGNIAVTAADISLGNLTNDAQVKRAEMGVANGVATLDSNGLVPAIQLPSYVDDILEHANLAAFPATGEAGKIYVAVDTNKTYRWSGSAYVYITSGAVDSVAGKTGIVTLTTADVAAASDKNYVTNAQQTLIGNTSGINSGDETLSSIKTKLGITTLSGDNTGDQTITLTGDITGTGTGSFATTIGANKVTLSHMATLAANSFIGNATGSSATPTALSTTQAKTLLAIAQADVAGLTAALTAKAAFTAQTFTGKQTFQASVAGSASVTIPSGVDPTSPVAGDIWMSFNSLKFHTGIASKTLAYTDSVFPGSQIVGSILGNAANVTGTVAVANGGTGATTVAAARTALGAVTKYAANVGNGSLTTITVTHNLGTLDVTVALYEVSTSAMMFPDITLVDANSLTLGFTVAPTINQYRVVVTG